MFQPFKTLRPAAPETRYSTTEVPISACVNQAITSLDYSSDGLVLAAGFEDAPGLALWSFSGRALWNNESHDPDYAVSPESATVGQATTGGESDSFMKNTKKLVRNELIAVFLVSGF